MNNGVKKILNMGPEYLIMKRGEFGATVYSNESEFTCKSYKVNKVIDPTGAGDSFIGTFAYELSESNSPEVCIKKAVERASQSVTKKGTQSSYS